MDDTRMDDTRLVALLSWYDEPPTWLAATIASLPRIGVTHVVALDGAYPTFRTNNTHASVASSPDQADAVMSTATAAGMGCTVEVPGWYRTEVSKRNHLFRMAQPLVRPGKDWVLVIDADERIGTDVWGLHRDLAAAAADGVDTLPVNRWDVEDTHVTPENANAHRVMFLPSAATERDWRLYRALDNMRCEQTHYTYLGEDQDGQTVAMRNDAVGLRMGARKPNIGDLEQRPTMMHLKWFRSQARQSAKQNYYEHRNAAHLEVRPQDLRPVEAENT
jgi:hypothetical protein